MSKAVLVIVPLAVVAALMATKLKAGPKGILGDLNNDGQVTWNDYYILLDYVKGQGSPLGEFLIGASGLGRKEFLWRADINGDGVINILDLTALERILLDEND